MRLEVGKLYPSIQSALDAIPNDYKETITIQIPKGRFEEKLVIKQGNLHFIGSGMNETIITYGDYARKLDEDGQPFETFRTSTVLTLANDITFENLTIENHSGDGKIVGQAVALFLNSDRIHLKNCRLIGLQDTLLSGPIPKDAKNQEYLNFEIDHDALYRHYFEGCIIEGDIDFIFGSGNAFFKDCVIHSKRAGYITAASSDKGKDGFIFLNCQFTSEAPKHSTYLGRPWREHAHTVFIDCFMGSHIHPQGISKWMDTDRHLKSRYYEYNSKGPGAEREDHSLITSLSEDDAMKYKVMFELLDK